MYAVLFNKEVVAPLVATEEELQQEKIQYPNNEFIEMTLENSPTSHGMFWNGSNFTKEREINA